MSDLQDPAGSPHPAIGAAASVDLDLAFSAVEDLPSELLQAAGSWLDPLAGADPWHALLSSWLSQLMAELPPELRSPDYSLGLSLVDDGEIAALNADWRGKAGPTDVLAFAAQDEGIEDAPPMPMPSWAAAADHGLAQGSVEEPSEEPAHDMDPTDDDDAGADPWASLGAPLELGDIVISVETAARQASEHGHSLVQELQFLASHGLLHLLGWDHPDDASLAAMLARQEALLASTPAELPHPA